MQEDPHWFILGVFGAILVVLIVFFVVGVLAGGDRSTDPNGGNTGSHQIAPTPVKPAG